MAKSSRRPQQIYAIIMWLLSVVFATFLIGLGSLVIKDLPNASQPPQLNDFVDQVEISKLDNQLQLVRSQRSTLTQKISDASQARSAAQNDYTSLRASFDNWIKTRQATESSDQNPELISRTRELEAAQEKAREAARRVETYQQEKTQVDRQFSQIQSKQAEIRRAAEPAHRRARRAEELKVFLYRLALTLPLLIAAAWMIAKKRQSSYWPLYRGFTLFALFAFFIELLPYLPSYGGYVRFGVGILMTMLAGHYIIKTMRGYLERKQAEENRSETERRQSIKYETALRKIDADTCPGCDRAITKKDDVMSDFCVHCGIRLQQDCKSCGARNNSFHRFCLSCGTPSEMNPVPQNS